MIEINEIEFLKLQNQKLKLELNNLKYENLYKEINNILNIAYFCSICPSKKCDGCHSDDCNENKIIKIKECLMHKEGEEGFMREWCT